jgi:hypothetical protein
MTPPKRRRGLEAGKREILVAQGGELAIAELRAQNPEAAFATIAKEGARLANLRETQGPGFSL